MESTQSRLSSARMEHIRNPLSTENDTPKMEEILQAICDIQSIDIDKLRTHLLQSSKPVGVVDDLTQKTNCTLESQKREADRVRKRLQEEQEFKKEYVKAFGERKLNDLHKMMEEMTGFIEELQKETEQLRGKNKDLEEEKRVALEEKANACTRLSKQMEDQMTYNNPNIADLSDQNQPNNLGERYTELYENQWNDAFEVLAETYKQNEENTTGILLKLLIECHNFANLRAEQQMNDLVKSISGDPTMIVGDEIKRHLKKARKLVDVRSADLLFQECNRHIQDRLKFARLYLDEKEMKKYLIECFHLCWLMAIQDPPVVLGKEAKYADDFDLGLYNHYTRSGNMVHFVVWPPLLLQKGGPLLAKGVAQPIQEKRYTITTSGKKEYKHVWDDRDRAEQREQPKGSTSDLPSLMLSSTREIDDPKLWMKTHHPLTPKSSMSTFATTLNPHFRSTHEQEPIIIRTRIKYEMQPVETSYSHANADLNKYQHITSTVGNTENRVITGDVLNSSQRTGSRHGIGIRGQSHAESTTATSSFRTRGTSDGYEPLQEHDESQFRTFKTRLGLYGMEYTKTFYPQDFDRFYTIYLMTLKRQSDSKSYA